MILDTIADRTRERVEALKIQRPLETLQKQIEQREQREQREQKEQIEQKEQKEQKEQRQRGLKDTGEPEPFRFESAIRDADDIAFICEVKKASPSKGVIAESFPYREIALEYESAGAAAISCLTEPYWFLGRNEYLSEIAQSVQVPVLRKDFTVDEYQIYEAKLLGASAVLLICAILDTGTLRKYIELAHRLGLSALVEAHTGDEVRSALDAGARIVGVNNRDLKKFTVDVEVSIRLRNLVPPETLFVSESGIRTAADIDRLRRNGTDAVLIGESFMTSPNKQDQMERLRGPGSGAVRSTRSSHAKRPLPK